MSHEASLPRCRPATLDDRIADIGWSVLGRIAGWAAMLVVTTVVVSGPGARHSRVDEPRWTAEPYGRDDRPPSYRGAGYGDYGYGAYGYRAYGSRVDRYRSGGYRYRGEHPPWTPSRGRRFPACPQEYWSRW